MASKRFHAVVQVQAAQVTEPDDLIELSECFSIPLRSDKVIAGGESVTGIEAHADPGFVFNQIYNKPDLFKTVTQVAALSCGIFYHGDNAPCFVKGDVDGFGNGFQAFFVGNLIEVASGMKLSRSSPSCSQRCISSRKAARDFSSSAFPGWPRLIRSCRAEAPATAQNRGRQGWY